MPMREPLPADLAAVLRWLRRAHPRAAWTVDEQWVDDPEAAERTLRSMLPTFRAAMARRQGRAA